MEIVFSCLLLVYVVFIIQVIRTWSGIPIARVDQPRHIPGISIVIALRNEEKNIERLIKSLKALTYPKDKLEVIMVDDASNDRTPELLHHYTDQDQCFKWSTLKEVADFNGSYKKRALTYGISQAKYEIIVTTDADCQFHTDWTTILANNIQEHHLVMATGPVLYQSTGWIEALLNIELASLVAIGAASLEKGYPNMCNGANLAFTKKGFYQVNGYKGYEQIVSGDDEFLLYKIHRRHPGRVRFIKHPNVVVKTAAPASWREFFNQRKRWSGKWKSHDSRSTRLLAVFVYLFHLAFVTVLVLCILGHYSLMVLLVQILLKLTMETLLVVPVLKFMGKRVAFQWYLMMQILYSTYVVVIGLTVHISGFAWKNRMYK
jgi:cellulose synthase/poly-beta-1,6-N-acetylglucosamine synthase-like glycosyltransferase